MTRAYDWIVTSEPRIGTEVIYGTHNYCDPTTWFGSSIRIVEEVATDSGIGLTWTLAHQNIIDMIHGKIFDEKQYIIDQQSSNPTDPHGYSVIVKINGTPATPRDPFAISGGDYTVNYTTGTITFFSTQIGNTILVDYSYATDSTFYIMPDPGYNLDIERAKAMWSADFIMNDSINFEVWGYAAVFAPEYNLPPGTKINIQTTEYHTLTQLTSEASEYMANAIVGAGGVTRGFTTHRHVLYFRYGTVRQLIGTSGLELRIKLKNDIPMGGEHTTATFYCTLRAES